MPSDDALLEIAGELYDCAIQPDRWPQAMAHLAGVLDCPAAAVSLQDPVRREVRLMAGFGFDPSFERAMMAAVPINPFIPSGWFMEVDESYTGIGMLGRDAYFKTRFYREVLQPFGYCDAAMTLLAKSSNRFGALSLPRTSTQGEWRMEQLDRLRTIAPHVRRAVTIADLLGARALQQDMLSATLDLLAVAIVLVDAEGRIAHANRAGLALLDRRGALCRDGDHLSARDPGAAGELRQAIVSVTSGGALAAARAGIAIPVRAGDDADLAAWVLPLDTGLRRELAAPYAARAAVLFRELGDTSAFPGELFVKRYDVTPAECRVLMLLVQGLSVAETCDALGIAEPTVKTHLSRLFAKTGTTGQPDLMRLAVSALAPAQGRST